MTAAFTGAAKAFAQDSALCGSAVRVAISLMELSG